MNLMRLFSLSTLLAFPLFAISSHSHPKNSSILNDLEFIKHTFEVAYAPAEWKKNHADWDLDTEIQKAKAQALSKDILTVKECQRIVKDFLISTKDYHVSARFYSSEWAFLPFSIKGANGRYFFSSINQTKLSSDVFPFCEGDEIISFDSRPIAEVIKEFKETEIGSCNEGTDQALAEYYLTHRYGILGHNVPKGPITISVKGKGTSEISSYQLIWDYKKEKISQPTKEKQSQISLMKSQKKTMKTSPLKKQKVADSPVFHKLLIVPQFQDILSLNAEEGLPPTDFLGTQESFIPQLGRIWWEASESNTFHAYLFELPGRKLIGYIRIPSYLPSGFDDLEDFASIIKFFQNHSDALVIDQVDNPGGSVFYLYALSSMLTDQPLSTPRHAMAITQAEVFFAAQMIPLFEAIKSDDQAQLFLGESFQGLPMTYQMTRFFLNYFYFIIDEWNAGRQITQPFYLYGVDQINPDPHTRYTKPILLLINSLDFSGGDFFAAILQDNRRAKLLGTRTAGAGGFISKVEFPNLNGIAEIRLTSSIAERADKSFIENLGVTPDILYEIGEDDLQYNYVDYVSAIREAVKDLILDETHQNPYCE